MAQDAVGEHIAFPVAAGEPRAGLLAGDAGEATLVAELRMLGHHAKETVLTEGAAGAVWRLASDEGTHLKGTDLAPFPLGFFNAGLQSDLAGAIARLARARGIRLDGLRMALTTTYAFSGSFMQGTGKGVAERVVVEIDIASPAQPAELAALLADATDASAALSLVTAPGENTFALYCNGRRMNPATLPASPSPDATDPYLKYAAAPVPLAGAAALPGLIVKTGARTPGETRPTPAAGRVVFEVAGQGELLDPAGTWRAETALKVAGNSIFAFTTDESPAARAPTGLALATAGIAFCYMTQIARYLENMKLPIRNARMVQASPYTRDAAGRAGWKPCDTHLFLNGEADAETFEMLQRVAANTCYLHRTMAERPPLAIEARQGGEVIWTLGG